MARDRRRAGDARQPLLLPRPDPLHVHAQDGGLAAGADRRLTATRRAAPDLGRHLPGRDRRIVLRGAAADRPGEARGEHLAVLGSAGLTSRVARWVVALLIPLVGYFILLGRA